jgi:hypothetical protein
MIENETPIDETLNTQDSPEFSGDTMKTISGIMDQKLAYFRVKGFKKAFLVPQEPSPTKQDKRRLKAFERSFSGQF